MEQPLGEIGKNGRSKQSRCEHQGKGPDSGRQTRKVKDTSPHNCHKSRSKGPREKAKGCDHPADVFDKRESTRGHPFSPALTAMNRGTEECLGFIGTTHEAHGCSDDNANEASAKGSGSEVAREPDNGLKGEGQKLHHHGEVVGEGFCFGS